MSNARVSATGGIIIDSPRSGPPQTARQLQRYVRRRLADHDGLMFAACACAACGTRAKSERARGSTYSLLYVVGIPLAGAVQLDDDGAFLCRHKVGDASRDHDEAACRVGLQLGRVKSLSHAEIPGPADDCGQFVTRVRMGGDALAARNLDPIDPHALPTRVTEQLRPLSPVRVVRRREPPRLFRRYRDDRLPVVFGLGRCPRARGKAHRQSGEEKKHRFHLSPPNMRSSIAWMWGPRVRLQ